MPILPTVPTGPPPRSMTPTLGATPQRRTYNTGPGDDPEMMAHYRRQADAAAAERAAQRRRQEGGRTFPRTLPTNPGPIGPGPALPGPALPGGGGPAPMGAPPPPPPVKLPPGTGGFKGPLGPAPPTPKPSTQLGYNPNPLGGQNRLGFPAAKTGSIAGVGFDDPNSVAQRAVLNRMRGLGGPAF